MRYEVKVRTVVFRNPSSDSRKVYFDVVDNDTPTVNKFGRQTAPFTRLGVFESEAEASAFRDLKNSRLRGFMVGAGAECYNENNEPEMVASILARIEAATERAEVNEAGNRGWLKLWEMLKDDALVKWEDENNLQHAVRIVERLKASDNARIGYMDDYRKAADECDRLRAKLRTAETQSEVFKDIADRNYKTCQSLQDERDEARRQAGLERLRADMMQDVAGGLDPSSRSVFTPSPAETKAAEEFFAGDHPGTLASVRKAVEEALYHALPVCTQAKVGEWWVNVNTSDGDREAPPRYRLTIEVG